MLSVHPSEIQHYPLPPFPLYFTTALSTANTINTLNSLNSINSFNAYNSYNPFNSPSPINSVHPLSPVNSIHTINPLSPIRPMPHRQPESPNGNGVGLNGGYPKPRQQDASVTQALEIARESPDGAQDPTVSKILESALSEIWARVEAEPDAYVMTRDEFAVFNFFQHRFTGNAKAVTARKRYWDHTHA